MESKSLTSVSKLEQRNESQNEEIHTLPPRNPYSVLGSPSSSQSELHLVSESQKPALSQPERRQSPMIVSSLSSLTEMPPIRVEGEEDKSYHMPPSVDLVQPIPGVLPGLEYLVGLYHIFVRPFIDIEEVATGFESSLRYEVVNISGRRLYLANETSGNFIRGSLRENRPFKINMYDKMGALVLSIKRPLTYNLCFWGGYCCGSKLLIYHGNGELLGRIVQMINPFRPTFDIFDDQGNKVFQIRGQFCLYCRCLLRQFDFFVHLPVDKFAPEIGRITKEWGGRNPKMFSHVDTGVEFPDELDTGHKALLLGAVFLFELQFYEPHKMNPKWNSQTCTGFWISISAVILLGLLIGFLYFSQSSNTK